jgi:hypothetical protein
VAWMPVDQFIVGHPKTQELARLRHWTPRYTVGLLIELWGWTIDNRPDGYIAPVPPATIGKVLGMTPKACAQLVGDLRATGWVDGSGPTPGRFHDWDEWGGRIVVRRDDDRQRQRELRARKAAGVATSRVTDTTPSQATSRVTSPMMSDRREDNTRGREDKGYDRSFGTVRQAALSGRSLSYDAPKRREDGTLADAQGRVWDSIEEWASHVREQKARKR